MPTPSLMQIPKSRSAEEFESLCSEILTSHYKIRFSRYGRNGQSQDGIDLYAPLNTEKQIVAQCKNYYSLKTANSLIKQIEKDISLASNSCITIDKFIVMTSFERDVNVQKAIINNSCSFNIDSWFWEDIQERVCSDNNLLYKYYPSFFENVNIPITVLNEFISKCDIIKRTANNLNANYKDYKVAYHEENEILIYNQCVTIYNAISSIYSFMGEWYLQLQEIGIVDNINNMVNSIPGSHDASNDLTGATMIYTISNYLGYFHSDEKTVELINNCESIVEKLKS